MRRASAGYVKASRGLLVCCAVLVLMAAACGGSSANAAPASWSRPQAVGGSFRLLRLSCTNSRYCLGLGVTAAGTPETVVWNGKGWGGLIGGPSRSPASLQLLSCGSPSFCVESDGSRVWDWNGREWSRGVPVIAPRYSRTAELVGLACSTGDSCMAVDGQRQTFSLRNGHWTTAGRLGALPPAAPAANASVGPGGISCGSPSSCMIVNSEGFAYHWNGKTWQAPLDVLPPGNGLVSCPTAGWCMAMNAHSYEDVWSAKGWGASPSFVDPRSMQLSQRSGGQGAVRWGQGDFGVLALSCGSISLCAALDDAGYTVTYHNTRWSPPTSIAPPLNNTDTITCSGSIACLAIASGKATIATYPS